MPDEPLKGIHEEIKDAIDATATEASLAAIKLQIDDIQAKVLDLWKKFMPT
jgi:hypothetical protein